MPVPSSTPVTTSENQCAARYTRERAITNVNPTASSSHFLRSWSRRERDEDEDHGEGRARGRVARREGEARSVSTSGSGGRPRWKKTFNQVSRISEATQVSTNAENATKRRRTARYDGHEHPERDRHDAAPDEAEEP